ncbi:DUF2149 domain-containing protein [Sphingobium cloacae]|uniref:DUF2149 domain-containing protein n=1 Tax=Sphingobium cloacae TaxID=120107 RepID=A0A1E1F5Z7_9SPHN|nr:DUF2149 domain-containing protein [Sphingobium cloacae]BAV65917.1 hypothetical protein SCLO_1028770 [Sphingobium cloacae]
MGRFIKLAPPDEPAEEDPLAGVANLFDASIVFIVGLMITLFSVYNMGDLMSGEGEMTMVRTDASGQQEIVVRKGQVIKAYKLSGATGTGNGERLGAAYRLANGQIIYVPETDQKNGDPTHAPVPAP